MSTGIYCIRNSINDKVYIGQSTNLSRRRYEHWRLLPRNKDNCVLLQRAVSKYGLNNFSFIILEECLPEDLDEREIYYITLYKSNQIMYGYNISSGGSDGLRGHKKSEETRKRMSIANTKERHPMWGKKHTDESKSKMREKRVGEKAYQFGTKKSDAHSKYFGVYKVSRKGHVYWCSYIKVCGTRHYIGGSKNETDVAQMYDAYVIANNLPNPLNFPEQIGDQNG